MKIKILVVLIICAGFVFCTKQEEINIHGVEYANGWYKKINNVDKEIESIKKWKKIGKKEIIKEFVTGPQLRSNYVSGDSMWFKIIWKPIDFSRRKFNTDVFFNQDSTIQKYIFRDSKETLYIFKENKEFRVSIREDEENSKIILRIIDVNSGESYKYEKYLEPPWQQIKEN